MQPFWVPNSGSCFASLHTVQYSTGKFTKKVWDSVYSVTNSIDDISLFANTPVLESAKRRVLEPGQLGRSKTVNFVVIWRVHVQYNTLITTWPLNDGQMSA